MHRNSKLALLAAAAALTSALGLVAAGPGQAWAHGGGHGSPHPGRHHPAPPPHHRRGHRPHPGPTASPTTPPPTGPMTCMALYDLTSQSGDDFSVTVEVMNHDDTRTMTGWTVTWTPGTGAQISDVEDGVLTHNDDGTVSVRNVDSNATVPPDGAEVTFSFRATAPDGNDFPIGSMKCTSP